MSTAQRRTVRDLDLNHLSPEWRSLARAIGVLVDQTGRSLRVIERDIAEKLNRLRNEEREDTLAIRFKYGYLTKSVLSDWKHGKRKRAPKEAQLKELHEFVLDTAGAEEDVIPWDDVLQLLQDVKNKPASSAPTIAPVVVPVPDVDADRHNSTLHDIAWPTALVLSEYIAEGSLERASSLIRHVGIEAEPAETAAAVVACRSIGLIEASDAVIDYASRRSYSDILLVARLLIREDMRTEADMLLERALTMMEGAHTAA